VSFPGHLQTGFKVPGIAITIKQSARRSAGNYFPPQARQAAWLANELNGFGFILLEAARYQILPPGCRKQARGNSRRKGLADAGKHWSSQPEGIAGRCVSIVWKGIKNQVAASQRTQIVCIGDSAHESQALRGYAMHVRVQSQRRLGLVRMSRHQQYRVGAFLQNVHPSGEEFRNDLVGLIDRADKYRSVIQAKF
jgi:hypothetical protein